MNPRSYGTTLRVGLLQTAPRYGQLDDNAAQLAAQRTSLGNLDLAVSAELSLTGYGFGDSVGPSQLTMDDPLLSGITACRTAVGMAQTSGTGRPWNSFVTPGASGELHVQHKIHPVSYAPWNEHLTYLPGRGPVEVFEHGPARLATVICNDMWHSVIPWQAIVTNAEVLVVPVASMEGDSPETVQRIWGSILQHAALVWQCFIIFVNRTGLDSGNRFWGGSRVVAPDGRILAQLGSDPEATAVDLDLAQLHDIRARSPRLAEELSSASTPLILGALAQARTC